MKTTQTISTRKLSSRILAPVMAIVMVLALTLAAMPAFAAADLKFRSANLSLESDISVKFWMDESFFTTEGYSDPYAVFTLNGESTTVSKYTQVSGYYVFTFSNIAPQEMNDSITAVPHAKLNGSDVTGKSTSYSVKKYCDSALKNENNPDSLKGLIVDLLDYGAAAQLYTGHNTNALVNAALTAEQRAYSTTSVRDYVKVTNTKYKTISNPTASWKTVSLYLENAIDIKVGFSSTVAPAYVEVKNEAGDVVSKITDLEYDESTQRYTALFNELNPAQLSDTFLFTVCNSSNKAISNTLAYSVESYAAGQAGGEGALADLVKAMMKYGDAAYNYVYGATGDGLILVDTDPEDNAAMVIDYLAIFGK